MLPDAFFVFLTILWLVLTGLLIDGYLNGP
jgi:hypothetical protein